MIRRWCYGTILTSFASCILISMITGENGIHEFEVSPPDDILDYAAFIPGLFVDLAQFLFSCVTWDYIPNMPSDLRIALIALSTLPVAVVFVMDILPPLATAIGKIIDGILPG